ncbi:MAG: hypothetical protein GXO82_05620 [Chlorobi bacterium]|nr:hypothetical protein [Chlorobiota bacterium]
MQYRLAWIFIVFFLTASGTWAQDFVVINIKGKVEYKNRGHGKWKPIKVGLALKGRDRVRTSFGSYVKLMYKKSRLLSIDENRTVYLREISPRAESDSPSSTMNQIMGYLGDRLRSQGKRKPVNIMGAVRGGEADFNAYYPRSCAIRTTRPTFKWIGDDDETYRFTLFDSSLNPLFSLVLDSTSFPYDGGAPELARDQTYYWRIERTSDGMDTDPVSFVVLAEDSVQTIENELQRLDEELNNMGADSVAFHIIRGAYFENLGLFGDAFEEYRQAVVMAPWIPEYRQLARTVLFRMGLYNESETLLDLR